MEILFQSLIGWLQTEGLLKECLMMESVSIPYRLATNDELKIVVVLLSQGFNPL